MAQFIFKMPDVGEGVAEAEVVEWHIKVGDRVEEDQHLVDVMTDKATIDIESPVAGVVTALAGEVGDTIAIGAMLLVIEVEGEGEATSEQAEAATVQIEDDMSDAIEPLPRGEGAQSHRTYRLQSAPSRLRLAQTSPLPRPQPRSPAASRQSRWYRPLRPRAPSPRLPPGFRCRSSPCRSSRQQGAGLPRPGRRP